MHDVPLDHPSTVAEGSRLRVPLKSRLANFEARVIKDHALLRPDQPRYTSQGSPTPPVRHSPASPIPLHAPPPPPLQLQRGKGQPRAWADARCALLSVLHLLSRTGILVLEHLFARTNFQATQQGGLPAVWLSDAAIAESIDRDRSVVTKGRQEIMDLGIYRDATADEARQVLASSRAGRHGRPPTVRLLVDPSAWNREELWERQRRRETSRAPLRADGPSSRSA